MTSSNRISNTNTIVSNPINITNNGKHSHHQTFSTSLFGISSALVLFFVTFTLFLLGYIYKKKEKNNRKNRKFRISLNDLCEFLSVISSLKKSQN